MAEVKGGHLTQVNTFRLNPSPLARQAVVLDLPIYTGGMEG